MLILLLIAIGLLVGIISSFFGIGGGILIVPSLYALFPKMSPLTVIGTSLGLIFLNSIINVFNFVKIGLRPRRKFIILIGAGAFGGVFIASSIAMSVDRNILRYIFGAILSLIILRLAAFSPPSTKSDSAIWEEEPQPIKTATTGLAGGLISGLTGLGGGAVVVPLLISYLKVPIKFVSVYSNGAMIFITLLGLCRYVLISAPLPHNIPASFQPFQLGQVNIGIIACLFLGSFLSSKWGVKLDVAVRPQTKKRLLITIMLLVVIRIFLS